MRSDVLASTLRLLQAGGYERLTVADVAADAGVAESTVYRRWRTKPELVAAAVLTLVDREVVVPDTGSLDSDLRAWLGEIARFVRRPDVIRLLRAVAALDDGVPGAVAAREGFWSARHERFVEVVERGKSRGELAPDVDAYELGELLLGPLYLRVLFIGLPVDEPFLHRSVDRLRRVFPVPPDGPPDGVSGPGRT